MYKRCWFCFCVHWYWQQQRFFSHSMNPELDVGQVEGAFMMGLGMWLTEKLIHNPQTGRNLTNGTWVSSSTSLNYLLNQASCQLLLPFLCLFVCFVLFCFVLFFPTASRLVLYFLFLISLIIDFLNVGNFWAIISAATSINVLVLFPNVSDLFKFFVFVFFFFHNCSSIILNLSYDTVS